MKVSWKFGIKMEVFSNILPAFLISLKNLKLFGELNRKSGFQFLIIFIQLIFPLSFLNDKKSCNKKIKLYW